MSKEEVNNTVHNNPVVVYSKSYCPYCTKVKELLKTLNVAHIKIIELDNVADGSAIQQILKELTGQSTVPNVWIGGKFIGGCDSTVALHKAGNLVPALTTAGAF